MESGLKTCNTALVLNACPMVVHLLEYFKEAVSMEKVLTSGLTTQLMKENGKLAR
jgi:hypothetical protein